MYSAKYNVMDRGRMKAFALPTSYVVYDLETSTKFEDGGEIVEFGAVKVIDGNVVEPPFHEMCALDGNMVPEATNRNHITDEMLVGKRPLAEVYLDFVAFVDGLPLIGYNSASFDDLFISREAERAGIESPVDERARDVMVDLHGTKDPAKLKRYSLAKDCEDYGIVNETAHRALSDAKATQELFEVMRVEWQDNSTDWRDIGVTPTSHELAGEVICFTGSTYFYPKRKCMEVARAHGAELTNDINTRETANNKLATMLVKLEKRESDRVEKAIQYGIKVVEAEEFLDMVGLPAGRPVDYRPGVPTAKDITIQGKSFSFANGLLTLDPFEGYQIVRERGGIPAIIKSNAVKAGTDYFVVTDDLAYGIKETAYVVKAQVKGVTIVPESVFWDATGLKLSPKGVADHWILVDDSIEEGKVDVSNKPAWDGTVAPYKLFIQHSSVKSTHAGGWNVIACGFLMGDESFTENAGAVTRLPDGTIIMDTLHGFFLDGTPKNPVPWAEWRNDVGKVIICDRYKPTSCAYLFDGLQRCAEYDLSGLDTSNAVSMRAMFRGSASVDYFMTTDRFRTSNVTDMGSMFFGCIGARVINCIDWDISKVVTMESMFENSPAAVLFDDVNVPIPDRIKQGRMFDTTPKTGPWLRRM
ncbi:MAG: BspA family leucine-rich repeat surface protein [Atopobiaceae bacterium]|nr:BspA family leucine-rich repeat surface protein [Atopobiaceae bacterium]